MGNATSYLKKASGITMIELLVTVTIVGIMAIMAISTFKPWLQLARARDAQRRADIKLMTDAFESYADDRVCYPDDSLLITCNANTLSPYLKSIPCDPLTDQAYHYVRSADCKGFTIYANLEIDTGIDYGGYNYAVVSGNLTAIPTI